ncbi:hypothetical protein C4D60_Mb03t20600 [Musa balbisiana]|uniref:Non-haem dioxygenase N-terminal domain-containing protein n=1 Tax=Musa balbisiana TaxID=52838 RepID=A0A4S8JDT1_MUSBA|nr:hypothetical protein C4D60_Mb03t20600 [Musa balbisiana]
MRFPMLGLGRKGHGIPDSLVKEVKDATSKFFNLPNEEKVKIKMTPASGYRGYQEVAENITLGKPDMHEAIDGFADLVKPVLFSVIGKWKLGNMELLVRPDYPSNFKVVMEEYICLLRDLSRKIMCGIALALGGPPDAFEGDRAGVLVIVGTFYCRSETDLVNGSLHLPFLPNFDAAVEPFDFCMQKTGGTPKFGKVVYGEHLVGKAENLHSAVRMTWWIR